jgi:threonine/homoserine efflux transporter RhtA
LPFFGAFELTYQAIPEDALLCEDTVKNDWRWQSVDSAACQGWANVFANASFYAAIAQICLGIFIFFAAIFMKPIILTDTKL